MSVGSPICRIFSDVRGITNLPDILRQVQGIGAIWAGPGDLSVSMGRRGNATHPDVEAARLKILAICKDHGVACAAGVSPTADAATRLEQGFRLVMVPPTRSMEVLTQARRVAGRHDAVERSNA